MSSREKQVKGRSLLKNTWCLFGVGLFVYLLIVRWGLIFSFVVFWIAGCLRVSLCWQSRVLCISVKTKVVLIRTLGAIYKFEFD